MSGGVAGRERPGFGSAGGDRSRLRFLLPLACAAAAAVLAASEFMTMFEFRVLGEVERTLEAGDRHYYALLVLAAFALLALIAALITGSRPAAFAVAACGALALLIFLLVDLPDVSKRGSLTAPEFVDSKAEPAVGFWLALVGAAGLALSGALLASLPSDQLRMLGSAPEAPDRALYDQETGEIGAGRGEPGAADAGRRGGSKSPVDSPPRVR